ncbi:unnamed protein product [Cuscuta epithymum]|uniref:Uncharacterized protein n=1 Tax=Cuscuta epithymum TaxID=186058 RepID=A0AAV0FDG7_9ASTE|nr:unnamed protein product [Cuscuta epithymum]
MMRNKKLLWRPVVPQPWEREFCLQATGGLYRSWNKFLEAKKYVHLDDKIMRWDDTAAEEAFNYYKAMFYAAKFKLSDGPPTTYPGISHSFQPPVDDETIDGDEFDDKVKVNDFDDDGLFGSANDIAESDKEEEDGDYCCGMNNVQESMRIEDIKPTGWDVEPYQYGAPNNLTGLIVGGSSKYWP